MANSTTIKDYLGAGTLAARPVAPPVAAGVAAFYFATDTSATYVWSGSAWVQVNAAGGGAASALTKLNEVAVPSGGQATIDFPAITQTYRTLKVDYVLRSGAAVLQDTMNLRYNGDAGATYDHQRFMSYGGSTQIITVNAETAAEFGQCVGSSSPAGLFGAGELTIPNYAGTVGQKSATSVQANVIGTGSDNIRTIQNTAHWRSTAAITEITLSLGSGGLFVAGSVASLYGIV